MSDVAESEGDNEDVEEDGEEEEEEEEWRLTKSISANISHAVHITDIFTDYFYIKKNVILIGSIPIHFKHKSNQNLSNQYREYKSAYHALVFKPQRYEVGRQFENFLTSFLHFS